MKFYLILIFYNISSDFTMILGVYWYFKFPENLYHFKFFKFFEGIGGHADNAAELITRIKVNNPKDFILKLETLKTEYKQAFLHLSSDDNQLVITLGGYHLFDYCFQFALEIEELLILEHAISIDFSTPFTAKASKTYHAETTFTNIKYNFIQIVGSDFKKDNAEVLSVRIDCNLPLSSKRDMLHALTSICKEENISVFYYNMYEFKDQCNLMLFFTNGRQYKDRIQHVDVNSLGSKVRNLSQKFQLQFGHFGGMPYYPRNGPHVELMQDENYILN
ncbi:hypothetical protein [Chryseobacterium indologenes]|nr:hypothetical protein [Chryseobacterium indologenes]